MDMKMKSKEIRIRKTKKLTTLLSQAEIIKRINNSTRKSYKLFELLAWSGKGYEK
jgi:hypothetical protein